jgi:hypothetical protein
MAGTMAPFLDRLHGVAGLPLRRGEAVDQPALILVAMAQLPLVEDEIAAVDLALGHRAAERRGAGAAEEGVAIDH